MGFWGELIIWNDWLFLFVSDERATGSGTVSQERAGVPDPLAHTQPRWR